MEPNKILEARLNALVNEVIIFNDKITSTETGLKEDGQKLASLKNSEDKQQARDFAKSVAEKLEMRLMLTNDYGHLTAVLKEVLSLVRATNPEFKIEDLKLSDRLSKEAEQQFVNFLNDWNPYICKIDEGKVVIADPNLKATLDKRDNDLSEEDINKIIEHVSSANI